MECHKNWGESPQGFQQTAQKGFFAGMVRIQGGFSATYPAWISTIYETTDVNWCPCDKQ